VLRLQGQGEDLIFETVDSLREQRRTMVQAEAQYLFIYEVMRKLWLDKYGDGGGDSAGEEGQAQDEGRDGPPAAKRLEVG
jgi:protein-tyrosine phosphatase